VNRSVIRAVVFDLDNTLIDFMRMKDEAVNAAARAMVDAGLTLTQQQAVAGIEAVYQQKGIEYQFVFDDFLQQQLGEVDWKMLASAVLSYRRSREAHLVLYPRALSTLIELAKRGLKLAVVTDAPRREAWLRLAALGLHHLFDVVVTFEDTGKNKPDSAPFRRALEELQVEADQALMLGDWAERDMVGAAQVGMRTVFARYGDIFGTKDSGADHEINDIAELLEIVSRSDGQARDGAPDTGS
jgi:putative hydrolase of the HAD superfamily